MPFGSEPLRFPGQYFDQETGLHYNYFRDYDPSTGRYIESDPIGLDGGLNTYSYSELNPLRYIDPLGLEVNYCSRPTQFGNVLDYIGGNHHWATTDTQSGGLWLGGDNQLHVYDHSGEVPTQCEEQPNIDEQCANNILQDSGYSYGYFTLIGSNCHDLLERIDDECTIRSNDSSIPDIDIYP